jgi:hypothetical protein
MVLYFLFEPAPHALAKLVNGAGAVEVAPYLKKKILVN